MKERVNFESVSFVSVLSDAEPVEDNSKTQTDQVSCAPLFLFYNFISLQFCLPLYIDKCYIANLYLLKWLIKTNKAVLFVIFKVYCVLLQ